MTDAEKAMAALDQAFAYAGPKRLNPYGEQNHPLEKAKACQVKECCQHLRAGKDAPWLTSQGYAMAAIMIAEQHIRGEGNPWVSV